MKLTKTTNALIGVLAGGAKRPVKYVKREALVSKLYPLTYTEKTPKAIAAVGGAFGRVDAQVFPMPIATATGAVRAVLVEQAFNENVTVAPTATITVTRIEVVTEEQNLDDNVTVDATAAITLASIVTTTTNQDFDDNVTVDATAAITVTATTV